MSRIYHDGCEWDPDTDTPATDGDDHFRANAATVILGADGAWRLCAACAALPRFKPFTTRRTIAEKAAQ